MRDHNSGCSRAGQLLGSKAQAVKNVLNNVPRRVLEMITNYSVEVGFEATPWSDDCLGSKKWLTGYQHFGSQLYLKFCRLFVFANFLQPNCIVLESLGFMGSRRKRENETHPKRKLFLFKAETGKRNTPKTDAFFISFGALNVLPLKLEIFLICPTPHICNMWFIRFRSNAGPTWQSRGKVTAESCELFATQLGFDTF